MGTWMNMRILGAIIRHLMTLAGGVLVAQGYVDETTWQQITGSAVSVAGIALSITEKRLRI